MNGVTGTVLIGLIVLILLRGFMTGCDVYSAFLRGAERGMLSAIELLPVLCAMMLMLVVFNASGAAELLTRLTAPMTKMLGIPEEVAPIFLLRPLTGSGSLAALEQVFSRYGADSRAGMIASVLMGSSETIFYTMTVYLGAAGVRRLRWVVPVSLTAYVLSAAVCGWLL